MTHARTTLSLVLIALCGCESTGPSLPGTSREGAALDVHLLDANFVRFEGKRVPWEAFALDVRDRCRAAAKAAAAEPWVRMLAPRDGSVPAATVERLRQVLTDGGVKYITSGFEGS